MRPQFLLLCLVFCCLETLARAAAPTITSFSPTRGLIGTVVTVFGTNLSSAPTASINGNKVMVQVSSIKLTIATGTSTGKISVTTPDGTATSATDFTVCFPLSGVTLIATPSPVSVGTPIKLTATSSGGASVEYQFYRRLSSGWESLTGGKYLNAKTCNYTPSDSGAQLFRVNAREVGTTKYFPGEFTVPGNQPMGAVTLCAVPDVVSIGTPFILTASSSGGASVEYQFYRRLSNGWESLTGGKYFPSNTCNYTPGVSGAQLFRVNAREVCTTKYYPSEVTVSVSSVTNNPTDGASMVWVPGGTFSMGSIDNVGENREHPAHQVTLTGYWIYKYEVSVAQYRAFCAATSRTLPSFPSGYSWEGKTGWTDPNLQQHPIVNVSWFDAKAYAGWAGVSLPTEAQWEYAARGVSEHNFPWGGSATANDSYNGWDETKCANFYNSYAVGKSTWPVGSFPAGASWCGAQDMAGNVWEWCADWFGFYASTPVTNPIAPVLGYYGPILRGGSWNKNGDYYNHTRGANRIYNTTDTCSYDRGFRCVSLLSLL